MKVYKSNLYNIGRAHFEDGHAEPIEELSVSNVGYLTQAVFVTATDHYPFHERYIYMERLVSYPSEFSANGEFEIKESSFWQYDPTRVIEEEYISGEVLIDASNVYVRAPIDHLELYKDLMWSIERGDL